MHVKSNQGRKVLKKEAMDLVRKFLDINFVYTHTHTYLCSRCLWSFSPSLCTKAYLTAQILIDTLLPKSTFRKTETYKFLLRVLQLRDSHNLFWPLEKAVRLVVCNTLCKACASKGSACVLWISATQILLIMRVPWNRSPVPLLCLLH